MFFSSSWYRLKPKGTCERWRRQRWPRGPSSWRSSPRGRKKYRWGAVELVVFLVLHPPSLPSSLSLSPSLSKCLSPHLSLCICFKPLSLCLSPPPLSSVFDSPPPSPVYSFLPLSVSLCGSLPPPTPLPSFGGSRGACCVRNPTQHHHQQQ